jgi:hypothetical protein
MFGDIFVFLYCKYSRSQFFIITSEKINLKAGRIDKTIYRKQFGNIFCRCAGFNLAKEPVRRKIEPSTQKI